MSEPQRDEVESAEPDEVTEASIESFPASDPPAFNASRPPRRRREPASGERGDPGPEADRDRTAERGAPEPRDPTTAQVRGAIPSARTIGVSSAHEPSAAPFDTDDEAAGRPASVAAMRTTLAAEGRRGLAETRPATTRAERMRGWWPVLALLVVAVVLIAFWLA